MPTVTEADADLLARRILTQRLRVRPKENVTIEAYPSALPWATGFVRETRRLGAYPLLQYEDERSYWRAVEEGRASLIGTPGAPEWAALERTDVYVYFWGPEDQARAARLPESTWEKLTAFNRRWYAEAAKAGVRGARMAIARVTEKNARFWGVPVTRWREEVFRASTRAPGTFRRDVARLRKALERGHTVRVRHPNGTDLTLALAQRSALWGTGEVPPESMVARLGRMASIPDANVYVTVDETSAEGRMVANRTNSTFGEPLRGGRFTFRGGRLTGFSFSKGGSTFREAYRSGTAGRDQPSFVEVGLDPGLRFAPGLEESERGAVTVGVGRNAGYGGKNSSSFVGFLTVGGADLFLDDRPLIRRGRIV
jgi:leucyl aminopeptidase (aminopeptidase T)